MTYNVINRQQQNKYISRVPCLSEQSVTKFQTFNRKYESAVYLTLYFTMNTLTRCLLSIVNLNLHSQSNLQTEIDQNDI